MLSETSSSASSRISMIKEKLTVEVVTVIDDQLKVPPHPPLPPSLLAAGVSHAVIRNSRDCRRFKNFKCFTIRGAGAVEFIWDIFVFGGKFVFWREICFAEHVARSSSVLNVGGG